jgi:pimeloyl-ACP methyl ester carboxylesterase
VSLPVLLVPGLDCSARVWAAQIPALWQYGPVTIADHTRQDSVDGIAAHILATAPPRFALAGVSMGGYVALAIQRAAPERIERLALVDTSAIADDEDRKETRRRLQQLEREDRFEEILAGGWESLVHPDNLDNEELKDVMREMRRETGKEASIRELQAVMDRPDSRDQLSAIAVPTLIAVGDKDGTTPPELSRQMAAAIPGSRLAVVPGAGHLALLEQPEAMSRELVAWLSAL